MAAPNSIICCSFIPRPGTILSCEWCQCLPRVGGGRGSEQKSMVLYTCLLPCTMIGTFFASQMFRTRIDATRKVLKRALS